jgi:hypothetical protein
VHRRPPLADALRDAAVDLLVDSLEESGDQVLVVFLSQLASGGQSRFELLLNVSLRPRAIIAHRRRQYLL